MDPAIAGVAPVRRLRANRKLLGVDLQVEGASLLNTLAGN